MLSQELKSEINISIYQLINLVFLHVQESNGGDIVQEQIDEFIRELKCSDTPVSNRSTSPSSISSIWKNNNRSSALRKLKQELQGILQADFSSMKKLNMMNLESFSEIDFQLMKGEIKAYAAESLEKALKRQSRCVVHLDKSVLSSKK